MMAPPTARAMQGLSNRRALCVETRDTERLMIGQSLSLIYTEGHTRTLCRL